MKDKFKTLLLSVGVTATTGISATPKEIDYFRAFKDKFKVARAKLAESSAALRVSSGKYRTAIRGGDREARNLAIGEMETLKQVMKAYRDEMDQAAKVLEKASPEVLKALDIKLYEKVIKKGLWTSETTTNYMCF